MITVFTTFNNHSLLTDGVHIANAVLVDMESKVISKVLAQQETRKWHYNPRACVSAKQGSGKVYFSLVCPLSNQECLPGGIASMQSWPDGSVNFQF